VSSLIDTSPIIANNQCSSQSDDSDSKELPACDRSFVDATESCGDALDEAFIGSAFDTDAFILGSVVDLDDNDSCRITEATADCLQPDSANKEPNESTNEAALQAVTGGTAQNAAFDLRRSKDPMERFVSLTDWQTGSNQATTTSLTSAGGSQRPVPKIKPSLMSDTISKRLFVKGGSPHVSRTAVGPFSSPVCARRNVESKGPERIPDTK
jgi:hypothetical protein